MSPLRRPELSTEFFLVPEGPSRGGTPAAVPPDTGPLRDEAWAVPLLVVALLSMSMMAAFEVFVVCKACRTSPSRRHLFLGQTLLLGLFLCSLVGALPAAAPSPLWCGALRLGAGVAYATVLAALLVKSVFLLSLNAGVYLPWGYQALLLLFAVLVQLAVGVQWLVHQPPSQGPVPYPHTLLSLVYCGALLLGVALLALKTRGIRDNYREAAFIALAAALALGVAVASLLAGVLVPVRHRDACLAFGLQATAASVFLVMFLPKGRQLAAAGRGGVYAEDREERLSSLSRAASPSFFHYAPPTAAPAPAPAPPLKAGVPLTDQMALVTGPPGYAAARMFHPHYYPYCYYPRYPGACPCAATPVDHVAARDFRWKSGSLYVKPDDGHHVYTAVEPTLSSNPNVFFQRGGVHPGMIY